MRLAMIVHPPQVIAIWHWRKRAIERKDFQAVARKVEVANDLRPQKRDDVRADRKLESWEDFFGDSSAAEHVAPLEHEHFLACAGKVRGMGEAVVASAD